MNPALSISAHRQAGERAGDHPRLSVPIAYGSVALLYGLMLLRTLYLTDWQTDYWAGSWDQSQYLRSARAFAALSLDPNDHWYPLLYSLAGAPFARLLPDQPFAIPDALCFVAACAGFVRVAARFGLERSSAIVLFCITTLLYPAVGDHWIEPWSTTLSAALLWLALAVACNHLHDGRSRRGTVVLGLLLGAIPLARPADAAASIAILLTVQLAGGRAAWRNLSGLGAGAALVILPYLALHLAIYGPHTTTYMRMSAVYGLKLAWLPWKAYLILVEPRPWFPGGAGLLAACPWLTLGAAGLLASLIGRPDRRAPALLLGLVAVTYCAYMLSYVDLLPPGMWRYGNVHYFKWLLPLFGLFALVLLRDCRCAPRASLLALAIVLVPACVRLEPVRVAGDEPARALRLAGTIRDPDQVYMARSLVQDRDGLLRNTVEYHQVLNGGALWAIAQKRDFTGNERWTWGRPAQVRWPVGNGARDYSPLDRTPHTPVGRYRVGWSLGAPCWLPPYPCERQPPD